MFAKNEKNIRWWLQLILLLSVSAFDVAAGFHMGETSSGQKIHKNYLQKYRNIEKKRWL